jgi:hypothetical protein
MQILIENNGQLIVGTNYWQTPHAKRGLVYLSYNAAAARLLIPADKIRAEALQAVNISIEQGTHQISISRARRCRTLGGSLATH